MEKALNFLEEVSAEDIKTLSPLVLAHIGDAYFHLYVRTRLLQKTKNIARLHDLSAEIVSAVWQSKIYKDTVEPVLSEDEKYFFKRGKNANTRKPRSSTIEEYHVSTGFETLLGRLFLTKNFSRLDEICSAAFEEFFSTVS